MQVYLGNTRKRSFVERIQEMGFGRLWADRFPTQYQCDLTPKWVLDNNVYAETFKGGGSWDWDAWDTKIAKIYERDLIPDFIVLPDVIGDADASFMQSEYYFERMIRGCHHEAESLDHAFVLQDGMTPNTIGAWLDDWEDYIFTLFLGGSDAFKSTAPAWAAFAHSRGLTLHYGRAGTPTKVRHAIDSGADSLDSAFPLWTHDRFDEFCSLFN
mgnify:CR=1 FL=1